jgi:CRISPR-associated protein Cmr3
MKSNDVTIRGIDTLLFRDGRPFDFTPGGLARTEAVPPPSTTAGFFRTRWGRAHGDDWAAAANLKVRGPIPLCNGCAVLPAPADAVVYKADEPNGSIRTMRLLPFSPQGGCDLPGGMLPLRVTEDVKPNRGYSLWRWDDTADWLLGEVTPEWKPGEVVPPRRDERVHIRMGDGDTAQRGGLFSTQMVAFERYDFRDAAKPQSDLWSLLCRIEGVEAADLLGAGCLGGERRPAVVTPAPDGAWPACPQGLAQKLAQATHVRMLLATPGIFAGGWEPRWLDKTTKTGSPPGLPDLKLKLVSAAVPRRHAISGWDLTNNQPKPVRWAVPAGAVYFFEVEEGDPAVLAGAGWLAPVSDDEEGRSSTDIRTNNRDDGFGLALWGIWKPNGEKA